MPSLIHVLRRPQALRRTDQLPPGLSWWLRYSQDWLVLLACPPAIDSLSSPPGWDRVFQPSNY